MNRVEDLSRQYVLPFLDKQYEKYGEHKQMELSKFDGYDMMSSYEEGYHQAEKDLELTWEDIEIIINAFLDYKIESIKSGKTKRYTDKEYCQEVLKRFKEREEK